MPGFGFLARCSPKVLYRLKKDRQNLSFQLEQQVSGRECERGESGRHTVAAKGQTFPWA